MEEEVRHLAGERHEQYPARRAHRWGKENGYCVVDGQKVPIRRTRLRNQENREQRLGSYELFQRSAPLEHGVWDKMMRGLSTRNYGAVVKEFREAYGVEKSAVSDNLLGSPISCFFKTAAMQSDPTIRSKGFLECESLFCSSMRPSTLISSSLL